MTGRLFLRPSPRAFFLITDTHALVFRQPGSGSGPGETKASRAVVVAEFLPLDEVDTTGLVAAGREQSVEGVLGVMTAPSDRSPIPDVWLLLLTASTPLSPLIPGSTLRPSKVVAVEFHSLTSNIWDPPGLDQQTGGGEYGDEFSDEWGGYGRSTPGSTQTQTQAQLSGIEDPCLGMKKYLESGGFFHAEACRWDISRRLGMAGTNTVAAEHGQAHPLEGFDERFVWNASLLAPLLTFRAGLTPTVRGELDAHALLLPVIQGFVGSTRLSTGGWEERPDQGALALISRLSWKRAGARFRTRGIDDDGNVANFVETETILTAGETSLSYTQVRGSVPLFWQQPQQGLGTLQQRVELTRPPQATQPAFDKHFMDLLDHYDAVHAINLLGQKDAEAMLSGGYQNAFEALRKVVQATTSKDQLTYQSYDFHNAVRIGGHEAVRNDLGSSPQVSRSMTHFGITAIDKITGDPIEMQHGVFRTNCLDCLDRTNYVQEVLSTIALRRFLAAHGSVMLNSPTLWAAHRELWADNGDRLSKTYAGTGAINTSATRTGRKTFAGLLSDATKSVGRAYINNFQDKGKQMAIDMLLGLMAGQRQVVLFDPVGDSVQQALAQRKSEYSVPREIIIFSGTWNVNGRPADESLNPWLFPEKTPAADIYAIAFQEIVELTPQQIVQTDPAKKRKWEIAIMDAFTSHYGKNEYILMRSEQLVGTALMIVVRQSLLPAIRNIEYAERKTGLQGLSGNKGGVGIRFSLYDSTVCLMTCHLAAGQANYADRNADYRTISHGLVFLRGKTIDSHDIVVWAADFNYRIDLDNDQVREYATADQLDVLFAADQLAMAKDDGEVFIGYTEGPLTFRPTYKYDNGTDTYDSSEKQRIPAWTDRVLYKGRDVKLLAYDRADLRTSDHRPVYAVLHAMVADVDEAKKAQVADELLRKARAQGGTKMDERVEAASRGGLKSLVKEFTDVSVAPSPSSSPGPGARAGHHGLRSSIRSAASSTTASTLNVLNSAYERIGVPPPLPPRHNGSSAVTAAKPVAAPIYEARRSAPPPPPSSDFKRIGLPPDSPSDEITPVATGDFVIVPSPKRPPPLPSRVTANPSTPSPTSNVASLASKFGGASGAASAAAPAPDTAPVPAAAPRLPARPSRQSTVDMDSPPPANLIAPVAPDNTRRPAPPIPLRKMSVPPATPVDKGKPSQESATADKGKPAATKPKPPVPVKSASLSSTTSASAAPAAPTSPVTSPVATTPPARPAIPTKPATLKAAPEAPEQEADKDKDRPPPAPKPAGLKGKQIQN